MTFSIGFISFFAPTTEKSTTGVQWRGGGTPRPRTAPEAPFLLWLGCRVQFGPKSCPRPGKTYIHATCPTRVVSKNDSRLGKTEVYGKRKNHTQTLRSKGSSKIGPWLRKNEGSRKDATRDVCSEPRRPARHLSQNVCGSHLAPIFGKSRLASNDFEQANA